MNEIKNIKEQVLKSFIAKELLDQSVYPTLELICAELLNNYSGLDALRTMLEDRHLIQQGEIARYDKYNEIQKFSYIDIHTLYRFVDYLEEYFTEAQRGSEQKITALSRVIKALQAEMEALHLANEDVNSGEVKVIDFSKSSQIDKVNSSAFIDYDNQFAKAPLENTSLPVSLSGKVYDIQVTPITPGYVSFQEVLGKSRFKMFDGLSNTSSRFTYSMPSGYSGYTEISIKFKLDKPHSFNNLYLDFSSTSTPVKYMIAATAKVNGVYQRLSDYQPYTQTANISFSNVLSDFIILNIRSYNGSLDLNGNTSFSFEVHEMNIGKENYVRVSDIESAEFITDKPFTVITLYADEQIPSGTDISYEIEWKDSKDATHVNSIVPYTRGQIDLDTIVSVFENSKSIGEVRHIDLTISHEYIYGSNFGTDHSITEDEFNSLDKLDLKLIRAKGGILVDQNNSNLASVVIYLSESKTIDFTGFGGFIDNNAATGKVDLTPGFHTFKFNTNGGLTQYKAFFDSLNVNYGACLAEYQLPVDFINRVEDNNYSCFTLVKIGSEYQVLVKAIGGEISYDKLWHQEEILPISTDLTDATFGTSVKVRATLSAQADITPVLKEIKIKLGQ